MRPGSRLRLAVGVGTPSRPSQAPQSIPLEAVPVPIALVDPTGAVVAQNTAFQALFDKTRLSEPRRKQALRALASVSQNRGDALRRLTLDQRQLTLEARPADADAGLTAVSAALAPAGTAEPDALRADTIGWTADVNGHLVSVSTEAAPLLGGAPTAYVGRPLSDVFRPLDDVRLEASTAFVGHQAIWDHRVTVQGPKGQNRWLSLNAQPVFDAQGRFSGYTGTARDITALAHAEAELATVRADYADKEEALARSHAALELALAAARRSENLKAQFLRNMNHEFHTPLNAIVGNAEMLAMGLHGGTEKSVRETGARIVAAGRRLSALFNDALAMATIDSGETDLAVRRVALDEVINPELAAARDRAAQCEVDATGVADAPHTHVLADPGMTARIISALLDNAIKFTPPGGRIGVQVARGRTRHRLKIAVWDTGTGVDPAIQASIFEPYTRGDGTALVASAAGPGLGLAVARAYARLQGGDIVLEKTGPRGSRFMFTLPMPAGCAEGQKHA